MGLAVALRAERSVAERIHATSYYLVFVNGPDYLYFPASAGGPEPISPWHPK